MTVEEDGEADSGYCCYEVEQDEGEHCWEPSAGGILVEVGDIVVC